MVSTGLQAVLLAGGRGTRMGDLTADRPKPLLEVAGRALLHHQLAELAPHVARAVIVTGYRAEQIEQAVTSWPAPTRPADVECVRQQQPLGTAHALLTALPALDPELSVLVLLGDLFVPWRSVEQLVAAAARGGGGSAIPPVLAVDRVEDPYLGAAVTWREDDPEAPRVVRIVEKPPRGTSTTPWNNTGVYLLSTAAVARCVELPRSVRGEYELPDLITLLMREGPVLAQPIDTPLHVGRPADLAEAERWLRERPQEVAP